MALPARKRKRVPATPNESGSSDASIEDDIDYQDLFRKAFEKKFRPLETPATGAEVETDIGQDLKDDSDWSGIDSEEDEEQEQEQEQDQGQDEPSVPVVDYSAATQFTAMSKAEKKAFMVRQAYGER